MTKFSDNISKNTIEGKIGNKKYILTNELDLKEIPFVEAMNDKRSFLSKFSNVEKIAISVWTTPKRTKTPPWPHVYKTLPYSGKKITIIPVQTSYGLHGDPNLIQPATISWITNLGIYVIIGVYTNAGKRPKGKQSANAKPSKKSTEGKMVFTNFEYELEDIENQITEIITKNPEVNAWNQLQIPKIPMLLHKSIEHNERLGKELNVPVQNFTRLKKRLITWQQDYSKYLSDHDKKSVCAQNREFKSSQKLEKVPGKKGKVDIDVPDFPKLHLTADSMEVDVNQKIITLLEGKNTKDKLPSKDMVVEQLVKLMIFKKCDFQINNKSFQKRLVCYLTGKGKSSDSDIKEMYQDLIKECKANDIEFRFNDKIIRGQIKSH